MKSSRGILYTQYCTYRTLINRYILLLTITFLGVYFADRNMTVLVIFFFPFFYLLNKFPPYRCINTCDQINKIADSLPIQEQEPGNCISQFLYLLWPHLFMQERVDYFKSSLQYVLDNNKVPYFDKIELKSMKLGNMAPQIAIITIPKNQKVPHDSFLLQFQGIYYPSFELDSICTSKNMPDLNIKFTDLTVSADFYIMFEFTPDPFIPKMPFLTAMDFILTQPPQVNGFNIKLAIMSQSSNLINKDSIKQHMSNMLSKLIMQFCGMPNGFVWDRINGEWRKARVFGSHNLERISCTHGEILRYSRIKMEAYQYCKKLCLAEPLTLQAISYQDKKISTHDFEILQNFVNNKSIETLKKVAEEYANEAPSVDELTYFIELSYSYLYDWFDKTGKAMLIEEKNKKKKEKREARSGSGVTGGSSPGGDVDNFIVPIMNYINFLNTQQNSNWQVAEKLKISEKIEQLSKKVFAFQKKVFTS